MLQTNTWFLPAAGRWRHTGESPQVVLHSLGPLWGHSDNSNEKSPGTSGHMSTGRCLFFRSVRRKGTLGWQHTAIFTISCLEGQSAHLPQGGWAFMLFIRRGTQGVCDLFPFYTGSRKSSLRWLHTHRCLRWGSGHSPGLSSVGSLHLSS